MVLVNETENLRNIRIEVYSRIYGEREPVAELIPHMLVAFLAADRGFAKARESLAERPDEN